MSNMSYCRFENTARDLQDCLEAIENNEMTEMSEYEVTGLESLLETCREIVAYRHEIERAIEKHNEEQERLEQEEREYQEELEREKRLAEEERQANLTDEEIETENTSIDIKKIVLEALSGCPETSSPQYKLLNNLRQFKQ